MQTAYELDSPMYFLRLLNSVHAAAEAAGGSSALTKSDFHAAALLIVKLVTQEMQHDAAGSPYRSSELGNNGLGLVSELHTGPPTPNALVRALLAGRRPTHPAIHPSVVSPRSVRARVAAC